MGILIIGVILLIGGLIAYEGLRKNGTFDEDPAITAFETQNDSGKRGLFIGLATAIISGAGMALYGLFLFLMG